MLNPPERKSVVRKGEQGQLCLLRLDEGSGEGQPLLLEDSKHAPSSYKGSPLAGGLEPRKVDSRGILGRFRLLLIRRPGSIGAGQIPRIQSPDRLPPSGAPREGLMARARASQPERGT